MNEPKGNPANLSKPENHLPKRPYSRPRLVTYGDITQLTQASAAGRKADGGGKLKTKTI
jgi:hypothetical protein